VAAGSSEARPPSLAVVALGCRVSRADGDAVAAELAGAFRLAAPGERADWVVVSTCAVTADAEAAARQAIRRAAREHPGARIVAAGCCAELRPASLVALPGVVAVVGARSQAAVAGVVARLRAGEGAAEAVARATAGAAPWGGAAASPARHTRPFLKVQDGCDARCSYCVVPAARGPSRSLPPAEALARLAALGARHAEVVLTGVHLGAWGRDLSPRSSLEALVRAAAARRAVARLRLSSVEPGELPLALLAEPEARALLCEHFHLPVQSGSPRVLAAMGRPRGPDDLRRAFDAVAAAVPGACLGTDVLAGFPGETDADHRATVALVEALPLAYLHVFPFSPRPGTPAASLGGRVPAAAVRARVGELRAISARRWRAFLAAQVGREHEVVVERVEDGVARGTARAFATLRFPAGGARRGEVVRVRVERSDGEECAGVRSPDTGR
jgi:threonylcarbamoyladenosine tRNA methylthiotransferase MtaB